jgi:hypothetical protein
MADEEETLKDGHGAAMQEAHPEVCMGAGLAAGTGVCSHRAIPAMGSAH